MITSFSPQPHTIVAKPVGSPGNLETYSAGYRNKVFKSIIIKLKSQYSLIKELFQHPIKINANHLITESVLH